MNAAGRNIHIFTLTLTFTSIILTRFKGSKMVLNDKHIKRTGMRESQKKKKIKTDLEQGKNEN